MVPVDPDELEINAKLSVNLSVVRTTHSSNHCTSTRRTETGNTYLGARGSQTALPQLNALTRGAQVTSHRATTSDSHRVRCGLHRFEHASYFVPLVTHRLNLRR